MISHRQLHRVAFTFAGIYNIAWGIFTAADPQWLFRYSHMPDANYPAIFAALGMVIGLYGLVYLDVARDPENGWRGATVGFLGKILGPLGLANLILSGQWPARSMILCLTNDLIWWPSFALYLFDVWKSRRIISASPGSSAR